MNKKRNSLLGGYVAIGIGLVRGALSISFSSRQDFFSRWQDLEYFELFGSPPSQCWSGKAVEDNMNLVLEVLSRQEAKVCEGQRMLAALEAGELNSSTALQYLQVVDRQYRDYCTFNRMRKIAEVIIGETTPDCRTGPVQRPIAATLQLAIAP